METLLKNLNLRICDNNTDGSHTTLSIINNPDGSPRWLCNSESTIPHFLKFYSVSSFRSWIFAFVIKVIFLLRLQKFVFETISVCSDNSSNNTGTIISLNQTNWAIFTGTVGINNKILIYEKTRHGDYFYKVAVTSQSLSLIENEESALQAINSLDPETFTCPKPLMKKNTVLRLNDISNKAKRCSSFSKQHEATLSEIYKKTSQSLELQQLPIIIQTFEKLSDLELCVDNRIPKGMIRKLRTMANSIDKNIIDVAFSHGDFTPWNMYSDKDKLSIYDWELANPLVPIGFDAFHFIFQQAILVNRKPWGEIKKEIETKLSPEIFSSWSKNGFSKMENYLELYLIINTVSYLHLYAQQPSWHTQVNWLLNTWNIAISDCIQEKESNRELLIMDVFDYLNKFKYAAIKFPETLPEELSEYSDIDLCIQNSDFKKIHTFLKTHPLTKKIQIKKKSFMASIFIHLADGQMLSVDLIWKFKRKSLVMLNAKSILEDSVQNKYGIRQISAADQLRYVSLFYGLNDAEIPKKYHTDYELIADGTTTLDTILYVNYRHNIKEKTSVVNYLKTQKENKLIRGAINRFSYYVDTIKSVLSSKGMTITFSGVDGAGKSTIIENIKYEIEKKIRKQVVVLRHRPSLLPILSVWTKGKKVAEYDASNSLPRQGNNSNPFNSLLRFTYYFIDYLFGQFYVFVKYNLRGWIVLYDRYYFDFINDSKRSNINLPKFFTKAAYKLLLKPELNFFLYADPATILSRKQELNKATISHLTDDYLELFRSLNRSSADNYVSIENLELKNTVELIMTRTKLKVA